MSEWERERERVSESNSERQAERMWSRMIKDLANKHTSGLVLSWPFSPTALHVSLTSHFLIMRRSQCAGGYGSWWRRDIMTGMIIFTRKGTSRKQWSDTGSGMAPSWRAPHHPVKNTWQERIKYFKHPLLNESPQANPPQGVIQFRTPKLDFFSVWKTVSCVVCDFMRSCQCESYLEKNYIFKT